MTPVKLLVKFEPNYQTDYDGFIRYWKNIYSYPNSSLYYNNINLREYTVRNLYDLFRWKNGMNLSTLKSVSFNRSIALRIGAVNNLKEYYDEETFMSHFSNVSTIWQIFLRHTIQPNQFPIFDQHVYRAFCYLQKQEKRELVNDNKIKLDIYFREYLPFYLDIEENTSNEFSKKDIDDALWAFGKFLNEYPKMLL